MTNLTSSLSWGTFRRDDELTAGSTDPLSIIKLVLVDWNERLGKIRAPLHTLIKIRVHIHSSSVEDSQPYHRCRGASILWSLLCPSPLQTRNLDGRWTASEGGVEAALQTTAPIKFGENKQRSLISASLARSLLANWRKCQNGH
jgi:hypothetical protein